MCVCVCVWGGGGGGGRFNNNEGSKLMGILISRYEQWQYGAVAATISL